MEREHGGTNVCWDVSGPETLTDDEGRFELAALPKVAMRLLVSGAGIRTVTIAEEELTGKDELLVRVELAADRCYLVVELADPERADRFELRDADGAAVQLEFRRGGSATSTDTAQVVEGRSFVLAAPEGPYELVLFRGEEELERRPVRLAPGPVNVLR